MIPHLVRLARHSNDGARHGVTTADVGGDQFLAGIFAGAEGSVVIAKPAKGKGYFQGSWRRGDAATLAPGPGTGAAPPARPRQRSIATA
jgi:hypothetical protein